MADQAGAAPPEDRRQAYKLDRADSNSLRAALASGQPDRLDRFWDGVADQMAFERDSIVTGDIPQKGLIEFRAVPLVAAVLAEAQLPDAQEAAEKSAGLANLDPEGDDKLPAGTNAEAQMIASEARAESAIDHFLAGAAGATLAGDLAAGMLMAFQAIHKPWDQHSQQEKRDRVAQLESLAVKTVRGLVELLAGEGRGPSVKALIDKITIGDKVQIGLKMAAMSHEEQSEAIVQLFDWQKATILIVSADANGFLGRREDLVPPDNPELPFDPGDPSPTDQDQRPEPERPADDSDLAQEDEESAEAGEDEDEVESEFDEADEDEESGFNPHSGAEP